jgi:hypothetical protein
MKAGMHELPHCRGENIFSTKKRVDPIQNEMLDASTDTQAELWCLLFET